MVKKYNKLNKESATFIIKMFKNFARDISRTKRLKKSNNSEQNKGEIESVYRDNFVVLFNSFISPFSNRVSAEVENNHGKTDIIISFDDGNKYIVECFVIHEHETERNIKDKTQEKYLQLYDNLTSNDKHSSLICFYLKKIFRPSKILDFTEEIIQTKSKTTTKQEKYKNSDYLFTTQTERFPEETFYIHVGIYHFYYNPDYSKDRNKNLKALRCSKSLDTF